jgi:hypothetical protein
VAGDHDPFSPSQIGPRDHRVAQPFNLQVSERPKRRLDRSRDFPFGSAHRGDVDQGGSQRHDIHVEIQCGHGEEHTRLAAKDTARGPRRLVDAVDSGRRG